MLRSRADYGVDMATTIAGDNDKGRVYENLSVRGRAAAIPGTDMVHSRDGASRASRFSICVFVRSSPVIGTWLLFPGFLPEIG